MSGGCQCRVGFHFRLWGYDPLPNYANQVFYWYFFKHSRILKIVTLQVSGLMFSSKILTLECDWRVFRQDVINLSTLLRLSTFLLF